MGAWWMGCVVVVCRWVFWVLCAGCVVVVWCVLWVVLWVRVVGVVSSRKVDNSFASN